MELGELNTDWMRVSEYSWRDGNGNGNRFWRIRLWNLTLRVYSLSQATKVVKINMSNGLVQEYSV